MPHAYEKWLASDNPYLFAQAAMKCRHAGAFCMSDGFCHFDGDCFVSNRAQERIDEIHAEIATLQAEERAIRSRGRAMAPGQMAERGDG